LAKTPREWIYVGIGCLLGSLLGSLTTFGCRLAYRRWVKGATPISPRHKDPQTEMLARRPIAHGTLEL
jgi:hypothetical protein